MRDDVHTLPAAAVPRAARRLAPMLALVVAALCPDANAQPAAGSARVLFADADLALGEKLMDEHRCTACHARKFGGDGTSVYRPRGRISTPGFLRGMVEQCNTELNLGMFPDEVSSVAAVLNRDHYRFD